MANPHKGEIEIEAGGEKYTFHFSVGAICALEEQTGRGIFDIAEELKSWVPPVFIKDGEAVALPESAEETRARNARVRMGFCRAVFWAGLQDHHPTMTIADAGDLMTKCGGMNGALGVIMNGMASAFPQKQKESDGAANPRKRASAK